MDGREVAGPSLERGVVFQGHALMPWLTVRGNIAFARASRAGPTGTARRSTSTSPEVRRHGGPHRRPSKKPAELSGGMKQRVGIARAFAIEPKMLLLDEPFGALDALTRGTIQDELMRICAETHQTVFMITHDVDEAILLADEILLMTNGPRARIAEIVVQHAAARAQARRRCTTTRSTTASATTWSTSSCTRAGAAAKAARGGAADRAPGLAGRAVAEPAPRTRWSGTASPDTIRITEEPP